MKHAAGMRIKVERTMKKVGNGEKEVRRSRESVRMITKRYVRKRRKEETGNDMTARKSEGVGENFTIREG